MVMKCGTLIKIAHDRLERTANNELREQDLTLSQIGVLLFIKDQPEHNVTMKDIEHRLHVAQSTTVGIIARMETKDFVRTMTDPDDGRVKRVLITSKGLKECRNAQKRMENSEERLLSGLKEEERTELIALLERLVSTQGSSETQSREKTQ